MISLILFVLGTFLIVATIMHTINNLAFSFMRTSIYISEKGNNIHIGSSNIYSSIAFSIGIVLVYFTAQIAKTYVLIKLLGV